MGQVTFIACEQEVNLGASRSPSCQRLGLKTVLVSLGSGEWNG